MIFQYFRSKFRKRLQKSLKRMDFQKILKSYMTIKTVLLQDDDMVIQERICFVMDVKKPRIGEYGADNKYGYSFICAGDFMLRGWD